MSYPTEYMLKKSSLLGAVDWNELPESVRKDAVQLNRDRDKAQRNNKRGVYKSEKRWKNVNKSIKAFLLWRAIGETCYSCGEALVFEDITRDHVFPASQGYYIDRNWMPACERCNTDKGDDIPTISQIQTAMEAYESIGHTFNPTYSGDVRYSEWMDPFKSIGMRYFVGHS